MEILNQIQQGIEQGLVTQHDIEELYKAISAGYGGAGKPTDLTYGGVIQTESLETTLKSVTFDMKNLKFWPAISIDKAYNLFEQFNRLIGVGSDSAPYIGEGGAPQEEDSTYIRDGKRIAFFGTRRKVTHQITLVRTTVGDVIAQQTKEGTMHLLKNIEREMYWGNGHFINPTTGSWTGSPSDIPTNSIAMDGLLQQLQKGDTDVQAQSQDFVGFGSFQSIGDNLSGIAITQDDIEKRAVVCLENFGAPDQLHAEPAVISALVKQFYPIFRTEPGQAAQTVGYSISDITTTAGKISLKPNLFLRPRAFARSNAVNSASPAAPVITGTANGVLTGVLVPGTYQYKVTAVNDAGESAPAQTARVVGAGESSVLITMTSAAAGVKYLRVYRSEVGGAAGTEQFVGNYKWNGNGMTLVDLGTKMPGLGEAFLLDLSADNMKFKQLAPLSKINLAIVTTAIEFILVLYGSLFLYTPRFNGFWYNVGK